LERPGEKGKRNVHERQCQVLYQLKYQALSSKAIFFIPYSFSCPFAHLATEASYERRLGEFHSHLSVSSQLRLHEARLYGVMSRCTAKAATWLNKS